MAKTPDAVTDPRGYVAAQRQSLDRPPLHLIEQRRFAPVEHEGEAETASHASILTVDLGGERMRCLTRLVVDEDTAVVEITGVCMSKNHPFRRGDFVAAKRERDMGGREEWRATSRNAVDDTQYAALAEKRRQRLEVQKPAEPKRRRAPRG